MLERELTQLYTRLQAFHWANSFFSRRHRRAALHVQTLIIDVNDPTDRKGNAVKFVGDIYFARLFNNLVLDSGPLLRRNHEATLTACVAERYFQPNHRRILNAIVG